MTVRGLSSQAAKATAAATAAATTTITTLAATAPWLRSLNSAQLHRLAVLLGTNCSGTKKVRIDGVEEALRSCSRSRRRPRTHQSIDAVAVNEKLAASKLNNNKLAGKGDDGEVRLVSVDMGIRNLAYAFFTATGESLRASPTRSDVANPAPIQKVVLQAWRKIDVSSLALQQAKATTDETGECESHTKVDTSSASAESAADAYHPSIYATHAYNFVYSVLQEHKPTHIIIERQRFRSGGGASVQEWSLRVGMFEAMLWAVLKTVTMNKNISMKGENRGEMDNVSTGRLESESVLPARVNRYWLEGGAKIDLGYDVLSSEHNQEQEQEQHRGQDGRTSTGKDEGPSKTKLTGREMKKAKIMIASSLLRKIEQKTAQPGSLAVPGPKDWSLDVGEEVSVKSAVSYFVKETERRESTTSRRKKTVRRAVGEPDDLSPSKITKLDDLADCFLQGLTWLRWRRNRLKALEEGEKAFDLKV